MIAEPGPISSEWYAVNDTVMGGVSKGGVTMLEEGGVRFAGILSLENNGGFSSIRSDNQDIGIGSGNDLVITVRGDGRKYYFDLRTNSRQRAFTYRQAFQTQKGKIQKIRLPIERFEATRFGRRIPGAAPLDPERIQSIGITLSDKNPGPFRVDLLEIETEFRAVDVPASPSDLLKAAIRRGVPLYNRGDADACAAIYETALSGLLLIPEKDFPEAAKPEIQEVLEAASESKNVDEKAWVLRRGIDRILQRLH